jgi:hypothetical protein
MACNPARFEERVYADEALARAFCQCCGRVIGYPTEKQIADGEMDGRCRWCELGHPSRVRVERPRLFEQPAKPRMTQFSHEEKP